MAETILESQLLADRRRKEDADVERLCKGGTFKKLHKFGTTKTRCVWCSEGLDRICWGKERKGGRGGGVRRKTNGEMLTSELEKVHKHEFTVKSGGNPKRFNLIFRGGRSLCLEASSMQERDGWVSRFLFAQERVREEAERSQREHDHHGVGLPAGGGGASMGFGAVGAGGGHDAVMERRELLRTLVAGEHMLKFNNTRSNTRFVWVSLQLDQLLWGVDKASRHAGGTGAKTKLRGMSVLDILGIRSGKTTDNFSRAAPENCCFSIVSQARTLDLQARDEAERNAWVKALTYLWKPASRGGLCGSLRGEREDFLFWYSQQTAHQIEFGGSDARVNAKGVAGPPSGKGGASSEEDE
jgi:hypothetical protein